MGKLIELIQQWFCIHEYELLREIELYDNVYTFDEHLERQTVLRGYKWVYVCKKCKRKKVITSD